MYEEVKAKFPHLSENDCLDIAVFTLEKEKKAIQETWELVHKVYPVPAEEVEIDNIQ